MIQVALFTLSKTCLSALATNPAGKLPCWQTALLANLLLKLLANCPAGKLPCWQTYFWDCWQTALLANFPCWQTHSAPTGARNSSLRHPNMAEASLGKNFPKVISPLLHVFSGWYLQRLVSWCVSLSRPQNIWCKRRLIARRRGDISPRDARISTSV